MLVKSYSVNEFLKRYRVLEREDLRILNVGSSNVRYDCHCVNIDIQAKDGVDVVCDVHELPASLGKFDVIICNAVLQYCENPVAVAARLHEALVEGGYLFVDAPWVQAYCLDTPDRFRFSEDGLRTIFSGFDIIEAGPTIRPGSAFAQLGVAVFRSLTPNRYLNFLLARVAHALLYPLRGLRTCNEAHTAGAFYLVCQKRAAAEDGGQTRARSERFA